MHISVNKIFRLILLLTILLASVCAQANTQAPVEQALETEQALPVTAPNLSEIIPSAIELKSRLVAHEIGVAGLLDPSAYEKNFQGFKERLELLAWQFRRLKRTQDFRYRKLVVFREEIKEQNRLFEEASKPLDQAVRQLGGWRKEWMAEKERWQAWQSSVQDKATFEQLMSTIRKADMTINTALKLIHPKLNAMLTLQEKTGNIRIAIDALEAELNVLILNKRHDALFVVSPSVFSAQYFNQFRGLWGGIQKSIDEIQWPGRRFFQQHGWIIFLQGFLLIFVIIVIHRNRKALTESKRWRFMTEKPFSTGFFLSYVMMVFVYEYMDATDTWKLGMALVSAIFFARLSGGLLEASWKRQFVYCLVIVLVVSKLLTVLNFPIPFLRLFTITAALTTMLLCLRWAGQSIRNSEAGFFTWVLRLDALFYGVIIVLELYGKSVLSHYLFISLVHSFTIVLGFMLFMYMLHGALEWLFLISPLRQMSLFHSDTDNNTMIKQVARLIDFVICVLMMFPAILMVWEVYDSLKEATKGLMALGFNLGSWRISVGLIMVASSILYMSFLVSWIFQKLFIDEVFVKSKLEKGARVSIARLVHYVIISIGFLFAVSALGIEITKLTLMLSALGVGIGFGLQGVVNNFVSGLILLFEHSVRVGDYIEFDGSWSEIKRIGLRATSVQTFDHADVIIPNADLVSQRLTNWTLTNRQVRLIIPVGVAYGSDVPLVMETLGICAKNHRMVAAYPKPTVLFLSFGDSSLNFELRVWVLDADFRLEVQSELHQEIDRQFREANIEIAFPQQDLHVRSLDESVKLSDT